MGLNVDFNEVAVEQMSARLQPGEELLAYMNWGVVDDKTGVTTSYTVLGFTESNMYTYLFAVGAKGAHSTLTNFQMTPLGIIKMVSVQMKRATLERTKVHMSVIFTDNSIATFTSREFDAAREFAEKFDVTQRAVPMPQDAGAEAPLESAVTSGLAGQIQELSKLHSEGILSDEEFAAAKQRLLVS